MSQKAGGRYACVMEKLQTQASLCFTIRFQVPGNHNYGLLSLQCKIRLFYIRKRMNLYQNAPELTHRVKKAT